jgi:PAS domain-containing protein
MEINNDITERKRAEIELSAREQRLRQAADAAQLGIFEWTVQADTVVWKTSGCTRSSAHLRPLIL